MKPNFKDIDIKKVAASHVEGANEANWKTPELIDPGGIGRARTARREAADQHRRGSTENAEEPDDDRAERVPDLEPVPIPNSRDPVLQEHGFSCTGNR